MTKLIRPLIFSAMIVSILASCSFFTNDYSDCARTGNPRPACGVTIELTVQADTSVPFNTVGQVIKYNYNVKNIGYNIRPRDLLR